MKRILANSSFLLGSQIITKITSFFYALFLAKNLSVEEFGLYTVALSYFSLVSAVAEVGINRYLSREVALHDNSKPRLAQLLCTVTLFRLTVVSVLFAVFAVVINIIDPSHARSFLTILAVSSILPQAIASTLDSAFIGMQKFFWSSLGVLVLNAATTLTGVVLINQGYGVLGATSAIVLGQIVYVSILFLFPLAPGIRFVKANLKAKSAFSIVVIKDILLGSLPYGILGVLGLIYFKIDTIMLSYMRGSYEVGIYGAAYKFLEAIVFIPASVSTVLFPILVKLHLTDVGEIKRIYYKSIGSLFIVSLAIMFGFITILPLIIKLFLPKYQESILIIQILSLSIPFMFVHVPGSLVLLASDKYLKPVIGLSLVTVSFNIFANLVFIPIYGYLAASVITVLSEMLSFVVFYQLLRTRVFKAHG